MIPFNNYLALTAILNSISLNVLRLTPNPLSEDLPLIFTIFANVFFSIIKGTILNFTAKNWRVFKLNSSLSVAEILDFSYFNNKSNNNFNGIS